MMLKYHLQETLKSILEKKYTLEKDFFLEIPAQTDHGDYATNIAFSLAKQCRQNPKLIAESLCELFSQYPDFKDTLTFSPINGFVNISISEAYLTEAFSTLFKEELPYPKSPQRTLVEYVSANPTGPLHIGHGRWAVLGSVITNLLKTTNHEASSEFYINDAGNQVTLFYESINAAKEGRDIPENGYHGHYVHDLAKQDKDALQLNIDHQKAILDQISVSFDTWFSEKSLHTGSQINDVLDRLNKDNLTFKHEEALWFKSSQFGDEKDRVLIKANGDFTYFLIDLVYHFNKVQRGFDRLINIWGADHHGYVARVKAGVSALCGEAFNSDEGFKIMIGQLVSLKRDGEPVRMSKRTGEMITFEEVIEEIGADATRYFLIEKSPDTHVDFDMDLAVKKSMENPVYYIQYAHARICSILKKCADLPIPDQIQDKDLNPTERAIILHSLRLYESCWDAAQSLAPHRLALYAFQLAKLFHTFYETCPILSVSEDEQKKRLFIISQVKETLVYVLNILGISAPDSM